MGLDPDCLIAAVHEQLFQIIGSLSLLGDDGVIGDYDSGDNYIARDRAL